MSKTKKQRVIKPKEYYRRSHQWFNIEEAYNILKPMFDDNINIKTDDMIEVTDIKDDFKKFTDEDPKGIKQDEKNINISHYDFRKYIIDIKWFNTNNKHYNYTNIDSVIFKRRDMIQLIKRVMGTKYFNFSHFLCYFNEKFSPSIQKIYYFDVMPGMYEQLIDCVVLYAE